jgi:NADH-quinone oxidoreductase subunit H
MPKNIQRIILNVVTVIVGILAVLTFIGTLTAPIDTIAKVIILLPLAQLVAWVASRRFLIPALIVLFLYCNIAFVVVNFPALFAFGDGALRFIFEPASRNMNVMDCSADAGCRVIWPIIFAALFFFVVLTSFAYTTLLERRVIAFFQQRIGPNRVGPLGFLQPAADGVKLVFKEDLMPEGAEKAVFLLAPLIKTLPILLLFGVIPIGPSIVVPWFAPSLGDIWFRVPLGLADPNVGLLWLLALTSIGTYGIVLAGWASNNKYAMLGALRASAQMISYELAFGLSLAVPIMLAGSMSLGDIMNNQVMIWEWYAFQNPLAAIILIIAVFAETSRAPFDLPEAEQELTQGYQTEYSGMKFAMFMMAEYLAMIAVSALVAATFFGGYHDGFGLVTVAPILGPLVMAGKIVLLLVLMIWVRATLPRIRYDRLMQFGWKVMLPLALLAVVWTAVSVVISDVFDSTVVYGVAGAIFFLVVVGGAYLMFGRGGESTDPEAVDDLDPMITGERQGIGFGVLNIVGGLLAVPFVLYNLVLKILDQLATINPEAVEELAIEPVEKENKPATSSGAD